MKSRVTSAAGPPVIIRERARSFEKQSRARPRRRFDESLIKDARLDREKEIKIFRDIERAICFRRRQLSARGSSDGSRVSSLLINFLATVEINLGYKTAAIASGARRFVNDDLFPVLRAREEIPSWPCVLNCASLCSVLFFPDDYNRVVLETIEGEPDSDYVNASYVDVSITSSSSARAARGK